MRRGSAGIALVMVLAVTGTVAPVEARLPSQAPCGPQVPGGTSWASAADAGQAPQPNERFGASLAHGDLDGDGATEVVAGAPGTVVGASPAGAVHLVEDSSAGRTTRRLLQEDAAGASEPGDEFGASVAVGDFNGDGFGDLAIGVPGEAPGPAPAGGAIALFNGSAGGLTGGRFVTQSAASGATELGDRFGATLATGDFNGDGLADLVVGVPGEAPGTAPAGGAIALFLGSPSGLTSGRFLTQDVSGDPVEATDGFGEALATGDVNGDGRSDLVVGSPGEAPGTSAAGGAITLMLGDPTGLSVGVVFTQAAGGGGVEAGDRFGASVATADLSGDGLDDVVVGSPGEAPGFSAQGGAVFVLPAANGGLGAGYWLDQTDAGATSQADDLFGASVAGGDLDGDGDDDVLVGAPGETAGATPDSGALALFPSVGGVLAPGREISAEQLGGPRAPRGAFGHAVGVMPGADGLGAAIAGAPGADDARGTVGWTAGLAEQVSLGPLTGATSTTSGRVWLRLDGPGEFRVRYRPAGTADWALSTPVTVDAATDFTGTTTVTGLQPATRYEYQVMVECEVDGFAAGSFETLPDPNSPSTVSFAYGADILPGIDLGIVDQARQQGADFMMLGGDQIYADVGGTATSKAQYEAKYRQTWAAGDFRMATSSLPTLGMWDDHEILNDWSAGTTGRYPEARAAFAEYQSALDPSPVRPGELYFTHRAGGAELFVLDTRTYRSPNSLPADDTTKTMLGANQLADLEAWLSSSAAPFKFIVSSVPWNDYATTGNDSWAGFRYERRQIESYVRNNEISGVLLLSGDQHWAGAFRLQTIDNMNLYEFMPTPLAQNNRPAPTVEPNPEILYMADDLGSSPLRIFGQFTVDTTVQPATLRVEYTTRTGEDVFSTTLSQADINPWESWSRDRFWNADRGLADPTMVTAADGIHAFSTSTTHCFWPSCSTYWVPHFTSPALDEPGYIASDAMPDRPAWVKADDRAVWAPSVAQIGGQYVMYFAATSGLSPYAGLKCLGLATSPTLAGPYTPRAQPLRCTSQYWNIDPYVVQDGGRVYLLWREDDAQNVTGKVVGTELTADGLSFAGTPQRTMLIGEYPWEEAYPDGATSASALEGRDDPLARRQPASAAEGLTASVAGPAGIGPIENPAIARHPGTGQWLLTWSANDWQTQAYATGLATCGSPIGPCTRVSTDSPWLRTTEEAGAGVDTTAEFGGIGGLSFVEQGGQLYAVMHGYRRTGAHPTAHRLGWVYRVTADGQYRLVEF